MTYHVVCHDCEAESIEEDEEAAKEGAAWHRSYTHHDVEWSEIA